MTKFPTRKGITFFLSKDFLFLFLLRRDIDFPVKMFHLAVLSVLLSITVAQKCPIQFDGRVAQAATLASFDTNPSPYNPGYVLGKSTPSIPLL